MKMVRLWLVGGIMVAVGADLHPATGAAPKLKSQKSTLKLQLRSRVETSPDSKRFHVVHTQESWSPDKTAIVVCDMWDLHHCKNATLRGAEIAPRMNQVLHKARDMGVLIIHAPSSCMPAYANHPARKRAAQVKRSKQLPAEIASWCHQIPEEQRGTYPIDQSDGGEDDDPAEHAAWAKQLQAKGRNPRAPWKKQTDLLDIEDQDYISDNGEEIWSVMEQHEIQNVILLGVHTNMCVLGRPFGLRQMAKNGKHVVLMRDMTDTMYNPLRAPYVSHFSGTDLIVEHIEKFVCPTITSDQILGGKAFRFKHDHRKHIAIIMAEREYGTNETLPEFAVQALGKHFRVSYVFANDGERNDLPGIDVLDDADVMLVSVRRRVLPPEQMALVRAHVAQGKAVVGIRTASHAFSLRNKPIPKGFRDWPEFDQAVFGGNYTGHHGSGPDVVLTAQATAAQHPILAGVDCAQFVGKGSLYRVSPLADSTQVLVSGTIPDQPREPIVWLNKRADKGWSVYTSLGHRGDFKQPQFRRLLRNALYWSAGVEVADVVPPGK